MTISRISARAADFRFAAYDRAYGSRRVENWVLPKLSLLEDPPSTRVRLDEREIKNKARLLVEKLGAIFGAR